MHYSTKIGSPQSTSSGSSQGEPPVASLPPPTLLFTSSNPTIALSTLPLPFKLPPSTTAKAPVPPKRSLSLSAATYNSSQPFFTTVRTSVHQPNSPGIEESNFTGIGAEMNSQAKPRTRRNNYGVDTDSRDALHPKSAVDSNVNQLEAKVVILGSQGVGKTSIVHRYTSGHFSYSLSSTIGASFLTKKLVVEDCRVRLQIWDTAGQERFRSMAPLYYRGALAAILIYDITNQDSFNDVKAWLEELRRNMAPDLIIHVVGSKVDLAPTQRAVDLNAAKLAVAEWVLEAEESSPSGFRQSRSVSPPVPAGSRPRSRTLSTQRAPTMHGLSSTTNTSPDSISSSRVKPKLSSNTLLYGESSISTTSSEFGGNSGEISRSGSKLSLGLGGLVGGGRSRRGTTEEGRKLFEETEKERIRFLNLEKIQSCGVPVTEVSAKDDDGIEDLFFEITRRLVERKSQIESDRVLRSRDSIMLHDLDPLPPSQAPGFCC